MEVTLQDVLDFRDKKAELQRCLSKQYLDCIIISLGMNIPGPLKTGPAIFYGFCEGRKQLEHLLANQGTIRSQSIIKEKAGYAAIYALWGGNRFKLKDKTVRLEESHCLGRLWDVDVMDERGVPLMRSQAGAEPRKCLICNGNAKECGRSRRHSVKELQEAVKSMLGKQLALKIGSLAREALLEEVYTTPKPGLVDLFSNGAHRDMDVPLFERSSEVLLPWFVKMAEQGYFWKGSPEGLFLEIRRTGIQAEQAMYQATGGVNTHKGLIFTLGIFCAAAAQCMGDGSFLTLEHLTETEQKMTQRILTEEILSLKEKDPVSNGEQNLKNYGSYGVRGEAICGYPAVVKLAVPVMKEGLEQGRNWNNIKLQTLCVLMSQVEDSNVLYRQNPETAAQMHQKAGLFLKKGGAYADGAEAYLQEWDREYIQKNISPGGCADSLAAAIFLTLLLRNLGGSV